MEKLVKEAYEELGLDYEIKKISDINEITKYGVMLIPALAVDGDVKVSGKVPDKEFIKKLLSLKKSKKN